jgi:hypothetical protein
MATFIRRFSERKPTTRCGFERTREMMIAWIWMYVVGRDQRPSEAIRGHQRRSEAIEGIGRTMLTEYDRKGNQRQSEDAVVSACMHTMLTEYDRRQLEKPPPPTCGERTPW